MSIVMIKGQEVKLKPCPFCGFEAQLAKVHEDSKPDMLEHTRVSVGCARCLATSKTYTTLGIAKNIKEAEEEAMWDAVEAWNRRGLFEQKININVDYESISKIVAEKYKDMKRNSYHLS